MAKIYAFLLIFVLFIFKSNWKSVSSTNVWLTVSGNQTVSEGGNVIFTCRSSTNNTVSWLDASYNTLPSTNGVLRLYSVTRYQNGNYLCRTNIGGLMLSRMVTLTVNYKPGNAQFTASNTSPLNGTDVTLRCSSNARPAPQYQIYIPGGQTLYNGPNGVYIIKNINHRSFGTYRMIFKCYAYNSQGSGPASYLQVNIRAAPVVRMTPNVQTLVAKEGTIIELKCEVLEGNPSPAVLWKRAGQSFQSYYRLTIHATRYSADTYTCVVTNTLTTVTNSVRLIVEYPPMVHLSCPEKLCTGQKLRIGCYAEGFPIPDVRLTFFGKYRSELTSGKGSAHYTISRMHLNNYGRYFCRASNSIGSRTSSEIVGQPGIGKIQLASIEQGTDWLELFWYPPACPPVDGFKEYNIEIEKHLYGPSNSNKTFFGQDFRSYTIIPASFQSLPYHYKISNLKSDQAYLVNVFAVGNNGYFGEVWSQRVYTKSTGTRNFKISMYLFTPVTLILLIVVIYRERKLKKIIMQQKKDAENVIKNENTLEVPASNYTELQTISGEPQSYATLSRENENQNEAEQTGRQNNDYWDPSAESGTDANQIYASIN